MKYLVVCTFITLLTGFFISGICQQTTFSFPPENQKRDFRVMFYNVENFFDVYNDSLKNDDEFLPAGKKYWNSYKYNRKLLAIYKVIVAAGGWRLPDIVGLCEVENFQVLFDLLKKTPLSNTDYRIIHQESPDPRGIDVAMLYRKNRFTPLFIHSIPVKFSKNKNYGTRDILYVKGTALDTDTLHVFINHWTSKWSGVLNSEVKRMQQGRILRTYTDSILSTNANAKIVITGDFNDQPHNKSLLEGLQAKIPDAESILNNELYNLSYRLLANERIGTHKHQSQWSVIDQFIVSGSLLNANTGLKTLPHGVTIFKAPFLLTADEKHHSQKTFRTYLGYKYIGGFSDHLPVLLDLYEAGSGEY